jgi:hypothetical protein
MRSLVNPEKFLEALNESRKQLADIAICDQTGMWSDQFFHIDDVREVRNVYGETTTALILSDQPDRRVVVVEMNSIAGVRFSKNIELNGQQTDELALVTEY